MRLLMVHGSLSVYRLSRLIKYSFYKNIAFAFLLLFYQIYCGFSGAAQCSVLSTQCSAAARVSTMEKHTSTGVEGIAAMVAASRVLAQRSGLLPSTEQGLRSGFVWMS